ncbi:MAG TPA: hypothetical protein VHZ96_04940 [Frankiaceae bacterium]|jgi:hypothetical protein|nr:hypothetical protein [Frankiaceae bacterium]
MERLAVGSTEARCDPGGIMSTGEIHAVRPDYSTLCGASAVFVFLEREFHASQAEAACPSCTQLAAVAAGALSAA